jgi:hypothetical protein
LLMYCVASVFLCYVWLAVSLIIPGDTRMSRDSVDQDFDAMDAKAAVMLENCSY